MRHFRNAAAIEDELVEHFKREGWPVQQFNGVRFIRIVHTTDHGEDIATEINLTLAAQTLWEKLS